MVLSLYKICVFVEDAGHQKFLEALLFRFMRTYHVPLEIELTNVQGGKGRVLSKVMKYTRNLLHGRTHLPDLMLIAIDSNCKKLLQCIQEIKKKIPEQFRHLVVYAIPDPHVERWMLVDSSAFKQVFGKGCQAPDQKCDKDRYKHLLMEAIRSADPSLKPSFGGMEYAEDIVNHIAFDRINDKSLGQVIQELNRIFKQWSQQ